MMATQTKRRVKSNGRARKPERLTVGSVTVPQIVEHAITAVPVFDPVEKYDMLPWAEIQRACRRGHAVSFPVPAEDVEAADRAREKFLGCAEVDCRFDGERFWIWGKRHSPWRDCRAPLRHDDVQSEFVIGLLAGDPL
jgi:hypothetical protein